MMCNSEPYSTRRAGDAISNPENGSHEIRASEGNFERGKGRGIPTRPAREGIENLARGRHGADHQRSKLRV